MFRRHDTLSRMLLTLAAALIFGMLLEARGLHTWAERLEVGPAREIALPVAERWERWVQPSGLTKLREHALDTKESLASWMLPESEGDAIAIGPLDSLAPNRGGKVRLSQAERVHTPRVLSAAPGSFGTSEHAQFTAATAPVVVAGSPPPAPFPTAPGTVIEASRATSAATGHPVGATDPVPEAKRASGSAEPLEIALAGDSMMAVGLAPTLTRGLAKEKNVRLVKAYRSGTGLARPEVFDWLREYPQMVGSTDPTVVICSLGANDGQNVKVGREVLEFGSEKWDAFYRERLASYLEMLSRRNARVLWIGMPIMKERRFARKMRHMNELVKAVAVSYPNVTWLDPNPPLGYTNDVFAQYSTSASGKPVKLRADDGIHMTDQGAKFLFPSIHRWLGQTATMPAPMPKRSEDTRNTALNVPPLVGPLNRTM